MAKSELILLSLTLALCGMAHGQDWRAPATPQAVPGEYIVMMAPGAQAEARSIITQADGAVVDPLPLIGGYLVRAPNVASAATWAEQLKNRPGVQTVEPNWRLFVVTTTPNDASFGQQWALPKIRAPQAWSIRKDSPTVVVAVVDTGIDYNHPDLQANIWTNTKEIPNNGIDDDHNGIVDDVHGGNFVPGSPTGNPMDDHNHGTHVAGIVSAMTNNATGVAGTTWKTQLMAAKFLDANGSGSTANAIKAIDYAMRMGAHVMNNSWGGGGFSTALKTAIEAAQSRGIVFAAAAGNDGRDADATPNYPSGYDVSNIIAVMASDQADKRASFSNWGKTSVDLAAPGVSILSTLRNNQYVSFSGTSMATPFVTGAAALVKAGHPGWTAEQIKKHLMDTADKIPDLQNMSITGGRLNLEKAVQ